jgi:hypothetical protein
MTELKASYLRFLVRSETSVETRTFCEMGSGAVPQWRDKSFLDILIAQIEGTCTSYCIRFNNSAENQLAKALKHYLGAWKGLPLDLFIFKVNSRLPIILNQ